MTQHKTQPGESHCRKCGLRIEQQGDECKPRLTTEQAREAVRRDVNALRKLRGADPI